VFDLDLWAGRAGAKRFGQDAGPIPPAVLDSRQP
jgi:hypothetical protein